MVDNKITRERKTRQTCMRITPTEKRMLEELSRTTGLTMADVLRQAVRREHALSFGKAPRG